MTKDELYARKERLQNDISALLDEFWKETGNKVYDAYLIPPNMHVPILTEDWQIIPCDFHRIQLSIRPYEFDYSIRQYGPYDEVYVDEVRHIPSD